MKEANAISDATTADARPKPPARAANAVKTPCEKFGDRTHTPIRRLLRAAPVRNEVSARLFYDISTKDWPKYFSLREAEYDVAKRHRI